MSKLFPTIFKPFALEQLFSTFPYSLEHTRIQSKGTHHDIKGESILIAKRLRFGRGWGRNRITAFYWTMFLNGVSTNSGLIASNINFICVLCYPVAINIYAEIDLKGLRRWLGNWLSGHWLRGKRDCDSRYSRWQWDRITTRSNGRSCWFAGDLHSWASCRF